MSFGLKWKCSSCGRSFYRFEKNQLKRELKEELEDGIEVTCLNCETENILNSHNAEIVKDDLQ